MKGQDLLLGDAENRQGVFKVDINSGHSTFLPDANLYEELRLQCTRYDDFIGPKMIRGEVWVDDLNIGVPGMQMFGLSTATVMVGEIKDVRTKTKRLVCVIFEYIPEFRSLPSSQ